MNLHYYTGAVLLAQRPPRVNRSGLLQPEASTMRGGA